MSNDTKVFHIFGWKLDGGPLVRGGSDWMRFSRLPKRVQTQLNALEVGVRVPVVFSTLAGKITYEVERSR